MLQMIQFDGRPGNTIKLVSDDIAQDFDSEVLSSAGYSMKGAIITVEANPVRIAFGALASLTIGHLLNVGDSFRIFGNSMVGGLSYISANEGNAGILQVTPLY